MNEKNSLIELMRFIFASIILLFHAGADLRILHTVYHIGIIDVSFFRHGYLGVEFFFVVSGYLMAKTVFYRNVSETLGKVDLARETVLFLKKKFTSVAAIYIISCVLVSVYFIFIGKDFIFIFERIPSLFLLQRTGIVSKEFIGLAWYMSSMLLCMAIIYPLLKKQYNMFTQIIGPLLGLMTIGYLIKTTGHLGGVSDWITFTYKCNLRAFAELSLGTTCFEVARRMNGSIYNKSNKEKSVLSMLALFSLIISIGGTCHFKRIFNDGIILLNMCVLVTILFGKSALFSQVNFLYQNKFFCFLGNLSMPIYLLQNVLHYWASYFLKGCSVSTRITVIYCGTIMLSMAVMKVLNKVRLWKSINSTKSN